MSDMLMPSKISSMFNAAVGIQEKYALKNPLHQPNPQLSRAMPYSPLLGASLSLSPFCFHCGCVLPCLLGHAELLMR